LEWSFLLIVAIQQPEHLPWIGFFHKMAFVDRYVYLDSVQFKKRYFENRNRLEAAGTICWLTVPVISKGRYTQRIDQVKIDPDPRWKRKYLGRLKACLGKAPYASEVYSLIDSVIRQDRPLLVDLNIALIDAFRGYLGILTPTYRATDLKNVQGTSSALLIELCRWMGADVYLSGPDGRSYLDLDAFSSAGIQVQYHDFQHPEYSRTQGKFISHLSIADAAANLGPTAKYMLKD